MPVASGGHVDLLGNEVLDANPNFGVKLRVSQTRQQSESTGQALPCTDELSV